MKNKVQNRPGYKEFITLMAVILSITALSIDMMLPALPDIGKDLGISHPNDAQLVISFFLFGFGGGQLLFGPLSDCFGTNNSDYCKLAYNFHRSIDPRPGHGKML